MLADSLLRPELDPSTIPPRILALPRHRGYPVPWFVEWVDGVPEFRAMDPRKFKRAILEARCWVCGGVTGKWVAFVIGPMCALNRTNAEPPCHYECATWAAKYCPFLSRPKMVRRLMEGAVTGTAALDRNPGAVAVWVTRSYRLTKVGKAAGTGYVFMMGDYQRLEWYAEGRAATREEIEESIKTGIPKLLDATTGNELERIVAARELGALWESLKSTLPERSLIVRP